MAKQYTRIDGEEFEAWLTGFTAAEEVVNPGTKEKVYDIPLPKEDLTVRIFSTIQGSAARDCGADAIRTVIWNHKHDSPVGGMKKTLRIETWRDNLKPKIEELVVNWRKYNHGDCPACKKSILVEREGKYGTFLGCASYPVCKNTEQL